MKNWKKSLALLCVFALMVGYMPARGNGFLLSRAEGDVSDLKAHVTVTIAKDGEIVSAKETKKLMAQVPVEVTDADSDNVLTFNDAMLIMHENYCENGYAASEGQYGYSVNKLWNDESGCFGYKINGNSAFSAKDEITEGDEIYAWVYKDQTAWSDTFSNFGEASVSAEKNSEVVLKLSYDSYDESWNIVKNAFADATITVYENGKFVPLQQNGSDVKTDEKGNAQITFSNSGTYVLSAESTAYTLVPPVCKVTVTDPAWDVAYQKAVNYLSDKAKDEDTFAVYGNEWNVMALARSGKMTDSVKQKYIASVVNTLQEKDGILSENKYTEYSRVIIALSSLGVDACDVGGYNLVEKLTDYEKVAKQGLNGVVYALIALDTKGYNSEIEGDEEVSDVREYYVNAILDKQLEDDGWAFYGDAMDVDMTSMVLQTLYPYAVQKEQVNEAAEKAFAALSEKQNADGAFESYNVAASESTAQVICALSTWNKSCYDSMFVKNEKSVLDALMAFQCEDGSFAHTINEDGSLTSNAYASSQGAYAFVAYERWTKGENALYDMTDAKEEQEVVTTQTPATTTQAPATTTKEPVTTTKAPATTTQTPVTTTQAPTTTTQVPATTTQAPATTTKEPVTTTQAPATTTTQASATTQAPASTTEEPATTAQAPVIKKQKVTKIKKQKSKCQITFLKMSDVSGYQLQYATKKSFANKVTKTIQLKKNTKVIKKLKKGKTYYFRVRSYKKVDGKTYYGTYSKVKKVKIQK